ncbi:rod shape-determining protein MreD [Flagellimonas sp. DF-77]|uniref:rod shape-determining protein MreD n=1 Tax=Flagellimonas algarum TaxID=3230298 RepID=UPI003398FE19
MRNNPILLNGIRFLLLVLAQILVFNHMNFMGYINPFVYILFFYWYPIHENRALFILAGFALGFTIDLFSDTMALHSIAAVTLAYARPVILRFCFGANYEFQGFTFRNTTRLQRITFLGILTVLHHTLFFSFEILSFSHILLILNKILFTSVVTFLICMLLGSLFAKDDE